MNECDSKKSKKSKGLFFFFWVKKKEGAGRQGGRGVVGTTGDGRLFGWNQRRERGEGTGKN